MYVQSEKSKESKSRGVVNSCTQKKNQSNNELMFRDNRTTSIAQRKSQNGIESAYSVLKNKRNDVVTQEHANDFYTKRSDSTVNIVDCRIFGENKRGNLNCSVLGANSKKLVQAKKIDVEAASMSWNAHKSNVSEIDKPLNNEISELINDPFIDCDNSNSDVFSKALSHDMRELQTHAQGYLFQAWLRYQAKLEGLHDVRGGLSNREDPDIMAVDNDDQTIAIEAKAYTQWSTGLRSALTQLIKRDEYNRYVVSLMVTGDTKNIKDENVGKVLLNWAVDVYNPKDYEYELESFSEIIIDNFDVRIYDNNKDEIYRKQIAIKLEQSGFSLC